MENITRAKMLSPKMIIDTKQVDFPLYFVWETKNSRKDDMCVAVKPVKAEEIWIDLASSDGKNFYT